jgi:YihY family inner membrane protein
MSRWRELLHRLYTSDLRDRSLVVRALRGLFRFLVELWGQFNNDTVIVRASGMAYTTLLAIVPLVAVFFSVFSTFKQFAQLQGNGAEMAFQPGRSGADRRDHAIHRAVHFQHQRPGFVFDGVLFITAILLFDNIEQNFNALWHVESSRSYTRRFMTFTSVLLWAPILIALSFYITLKIRTYLAANFLGGLVERSLFLLPWVISVLAFFLLLKVVPATRVKWRSAMLGGAFGGTIWESPSGASPKQSPDRSSTTRFTARWPSFRFPGLAVPDLDHRPSRRRSFLRASSLPVAGPAPHFRPSFAARAHSQRPAPVCGHCPRFPPRPATADGGRFIRYALDAFRVHCGTVGMMVRIGLLRTTDLPRDRLGYLPGGRCRRRAWARWPRPFIVSCPSPSRPPRMLHSIRK